MKAKPNFPIGARFLVDSNIVEIVKDGSPIYCADRLCDFEYLVKSVDDKLYYMIQSALEIYHTKI